MKTNILFVVALALVGCGDPADGTPPQEPDLGGHDAQPSPDLISAAGDLAAAPDAGAAVLVADDSSFQFDPVADAPRSPAAMFRFTNTGGSDSAPLEVDLHGNDAALFRIDSDACGGKPLAPGASCHVAVSFGSPLAGDFEATLRVHGEPGGVARVDLSGRVAEAALAVSPPKVDLGPVFQNATSAPATLTVRNGGGATSGPIAFAKLDSAFRLLNDRCTGKTLDGGASCTVDVAATPAVNASGTLSATLQASAQPGGTASAQLGASVRILGSISVSAVDFGSVGNVFGTFGNKTATVRNVGDQATKVLTVSIGGSYYDFKLVSEDCTGKTLQPNDTCSVVVTLSDGRYLGDNVASVDVGVDNGHGGSGRLHMYGIIDGFQVSIEIAGTGTINASDGQSCSSTCLLNFHLSTFGVTLTAVPAAGFRFDWWGDGNNCRYSSSTTCAISFNTNASYNYVRPYFISTN